jgi:hypothetical protein
MRLNLGCGDRYVPNWHNVDWPGCPHHVDEHVDLMGLLPAAWRGQASRIYAGHLLEHLREPYARHLLWALREVADPAGCEALFVGPDCDVARVMAADGSLDTTYHSLDSILHGGHRWPGDDHLWQHSSHDVVDALGVAGWPVVTDLGGIRGLDGVAGGESWPVADRVSDWQYAVRAWSGPDAAPWMR